MIIWKLDTLFNEQQIKELSYEDFSAFYSNGRNGIDAFFFNRCLLCLNIYSKRTANFLNFILNYGRFKSRSNVIEQHNYTSNADYKETSFDRQHNFLLNWYSRIVLTPFNEVAIEFTRPSDSDTHVNNVKEFQDEIFESFKELMDVFLKDSDIFIINEKKHKCKDLEYSMDDFKILYSFFNFETDEINKFPKKVQRNVFGKGNNQFIKSSLEILYNNLNVLTEKFENVKIAMSRELQRNIRKLQDNYMIEYNDLEKEYKNKFDETLKQISEIKQLLS